MICVPEDMGGFRARSGRLEERQPPFQLSFDSLLVVESFGLPRNADDAARTPSDSSDDVGCVVSGPQFSGQFLQAACSEVEGLLDGG